MKTCLTRILALLLVMMLFVGCSLLEIQPDSSDKLLNGVELIDYTIVYSTEAPDYCERAAKYIQKEIKNRTGLQLSVCKAEEGTYDHEILVGDTDRALSDEVEPQSLNMEFYFTADDNHIAMDGDYFIIAAAAYYFVETYIPGSSFDSAIAKNEVTACQPITKEAKNFIFLIGDGMGVEHTKTLEVYDLERIIKQQALIGRDIVLENCDKESVFYGYYLPYQGKLRTDSLGGTTDSAASATALATGFKTKNGYVGIDQYGVEKQSLTELAASLGKATAVMSTEVQTGATPGGFSAHTDSRDNSQEIIDDQISLTEQYGTIIQCDLTTNPKFEAVISGVLNKLGQDEDGFFLMYEEAYIDKNSHENNLSKMVSCVGRFNQAIGVFMEYAFYHPETMLLITADHETGSLAMGEDGQYWFNSTGHSSADVPIFAYGQGAEVFKDYYEENNEVPKEIAAMWGVDNFGG